MVDVLMAASIDVHKRNLKRLDQGYEIIDSVEDEPQPYNEEFKIDYENHMHEKGALKPLNVDDRHFINNPFEIDSESVTPDNHK